MITLAIAAAFYYFTNENYAIFNGHTGIDSVPTPQFFWASTGTTPYPSTISPSPSPSCAGWAVSYVARAPFGLALQGIRDNPRRMAALGFNVNAHRVAAYVFAALIAALGGILLVWSYGEIAPGTVSVSAAIDILVIAVVGGIGNPIGAFRRRADLRGAQDLRPRLPRRLRARRQPVPPADRAGLPRDRLSFRPTASSDCGRAGEIARGPARRRSQPRGGAHG